MRQSSDCVLRGALAPTQPRHCTPLRATLDVGHNRRRLELRKFAQQLVKEPLPEERRLAPPAAPCGRQRSPLKEHRYSSEEVHGRTTRFAKGTPLVRGVRVVGMEHSR